MKRELLSLVSFTNKLKNSTQVCHVTSSDFIKKEFAPFYAKHSHKLHCMVLFDLLKHMMNVLKGNPRANIGKKHNELFYDDRDDLSPSRALLLWKFVWSNNL